MYIRGDKSIIFQLSNINSDEARKDFQESLMQGMLDFGMYHDDIDILTAAILRRIEDRYIIISKKD